MENNSITKEEKTHNQYIDFIRVLDEVDIENLSDRGLQAFYAACYDGEIDANIELRNRVL